jgi:hypothetical protein
VESLIESVFESRCTEMAGCWAKKPHAGQANESNKVFDIESFISDARI